MKKIKYLISISFFVFISSFVSAQCGDELVDDCASDIGEATYLKDFRIKLDRAERNKPAPVQRLSIVLNKGTTYKFSVCDAPEYEGKAIIQLYDGSRMMGGTLNLSTGKVFSEFEFVCSKTGVYFVFVSFQEGKEGCSAAILSYVEQ
jgi:hypothetical protein